MLKDFFGGFLSGIYKLILTVIFVVIIVFLTLFTYFPLQQFIFGRGDYLLFVSDSINMVSVFMIIFLFVYYSLKLRAFRGDDEITDTLDQVDDDQVMENIKNKDFLVRVCESYCQIVEFGSKIFNYVKIVYIPIMIIAIYIGMTSYTIVCDDTIKLSSPLNPSGIVYKYEEIEKVEVGISERGGYFDPYYNITVDGKTINLIGANIGESEASFEEVLVYMDGYLKDIGIPKTSDKKDFDKFARGLNKDYVREVKKLFD